jgi:hypothetical protein
MKEQLLRIVAGDPAEAIALLKQKNVRVLQRVGNRLIIEGELTANIAAEVSKVVQPAPADPLARIPAEVADEEIGILASRHRQTEVFRRSKLRRANEGESWDKVFERW